jgi:hypothetical protein
MDVCAMVRTLDGAEEGAGDEAGSGGHMTLIDGERRQNDLLSTARRSHYRAPNFLTLVKNQHASWSVVVCWLDSEHKCPFLRVYYRRVVVLDCKFKTAID